MCRCGSCAWPLAAGATLVVARPGGGRDPGYLAGLIAAGRGTVAHVVPSLLGLFVAAVAAGACAGAAAGVLQRVRRWPVARVRGGAGRRRCVQLVRADGDDGVMSHGVACGSARSAAVADRAADR